MRPIGKGSTGRQAERKAVGHAREKALYEALWEVFEACDKLREVFLSCDDGEAVLKRAKDALDGTEERRILKRLDALEFVHTQAKALVQEHEAGGSGAMEYGNLVDALKEVDKCR